MRTFYNENDAFAADWLEALQGEGLIAPGLVERRSVADLKPEDLAGFDRAHFFAGIGGWDYALRLAGWPEDRPVWTGSCPCQPFSVAGRRKGAEDERHLWPVWFRLIRERRPPVVFGEQVASPDGLEWFDSVSRDLEGEGYAVRAADLCAAGFGAPHLRQRLYFVAYAPESRRDRRENLGADRGHEGSRSIEGSRARRKQPQRESAFSELAHADYRTRGQGREDGGGRDPGGDEVARTGPRGFGVSGVVAEPDGRPSDLHASQRRPGPRVPNALLGGGAGLVGDSGESRSGRHPRAAAQAEAEGQGEGREPRGLGDEPQPSSPARRLGDADRQGRQGRQGERRDDGGERAPAQRAGREPLALEHAPRGGAPAAQLAGRRRGAIEAGLQGFWRDAEWIYCRDGKWRAVGPGLFPLAHGISGRMGKLRGTGNAIVPHVAAVFVKAFMEATA